MSLPIPEGASADFDPDTLDHMYREMMDDSVNTAASSSGGGGDTVFPDIVDPYDL